VIHLDPLDRLRLERGARHLHTLGPRVTAELLAEIGARTGGMPAIMRLLGEYKRFSPQLLRAVGANRFPPRPLRELP
jgi:hypothetical protein